MVTLALVLMISMVANALLAKRLVNRRTPEVFEGAMPSGVVSPTAEPVIFAFSADALVWEAEAAMERGDFAAARSHAEQALMMLVARRAPARDQIRARAVLQRALWPGLNSFAKGRRSAPAISTVGLA